jgi:hypothetical protein
MKVGPAVEGRWRKHLQLLSAAFGVHSAVPLGLSLLTKALLLQLWPLTHAHANTCRHWTFHLFLRHLALHIFQEIQLLFGTSGRLISCLRFRL